MTPEKRIQTLERLKSIRKRSRDDTRSRMSRCEEQTRFLEDRVRSLDLLWTDAVVDFGRSCSRCRSSDELWSLRETIEGIEKERRIAENERVSLQEELDGLKIELTRQHAEYRLAETILDSRRKEREAERLHREEKALGELALVRFLR
ncbi:MAG: hypothetical protein ACC613_04010 [Synergistales bacterium]